MTLSLNILASISDDFSAKVVSADNFSANNFSSKKVSANFGAF